jgi:hypothetical protein
MQQFFDFEILWIYSESMVLGELAIHVMVYYYYYYYY